MLCLINSMSYIRIPRIQRYFASISPNRLSVPTVFLLSARKCTLERKMWFVIIIHKKSGLSMESSIIAKVFFRTI